MPIALAPWSDDRTATLKRLWAAGESAAQIAASLTNATRNSVLGKIHRLGLSTPYVKKVCADKPTVPRKKRTGASRNNIMSRIVAAPVIASDLYAIRCVEVEPRHISLLDLDLNDCRYPYGDGPFTFCGHPQLQRSYCASHFFLTVGSGTYAERSAAKVTARHLGFVI